MSAADAYIPKTQIPIRELLSYVSAILGAAVTFLNERFDPARFREREVALGDLIHKFGILDEEVQLKLPEVKAKGPAGVKQYLEELRIKENDLLKEAEQWKAGVRRIFQSRDAA